MDFLIPYISAYEEESRLSSSRRFSEPTRNGPSRRLSEPVYHIPTKESQEHLLEKLLHEVEVFQLASHLFWAIWSAVNAPICQIPFGYWVGIYMDTYTYTLDTYFFCRKHLELIPKQN